MTELWNELSRVAVDRDIRVIIESAQPASVSVDGGGVGGF